ncbi:MAG TPA: TonB-dependent receptor [Opitutaceae bacterium]
MMRPIRRFMCPARPSLLLPLLAVSLTPAFAAGAAESVRIAFDLPADSAEASLKRFAEQAGSEVLFASRLTRGVKTNPVKGELSPRDAIDGLLANTGLVAVHDDRTGTFSVRREAAPERPQPSEVRGPQNTTPTDPSANRTPMKKPKLLARLATTFTLFLGSIAHAAEGTGTISGRVFNPVSNQYVRNAEIRVEGTNQVVYTESDGTFRLPNVPAGPASIVVTYTGYRTAVESVTVAPGENVIRQIDLASTQATRSDGSVVELGAFTVSAEREGNAKAIMEQRRNLNVSTSVASDIFGDVTDGDVGEFLKFLPGVDLDYQESATRGPRLGGMDAQYVGFTMDGVGLASADALRTGDGGRATSFDSMSITSIESIEISRTTSPDMDASSPAGTINLKTRRAFDRKGRLLSYNVGLSMNSEEFHFRREYGPGSDKEYKALPNYKFDYSDVFMNGRLGIVASLSRADSYREQFQTNSTHNKTVTATDTRPVVVVAFTAKDGPVRLEKDVYSFTADFKATDRLVLSNTFIYNKADGNWRNRGFTFRTASNNTNATTGRSTVGGNGVTEVIATTSATNAGNLALALSDAAKITITRTLISKFEYTLDSLVVDGFASYSGSFNDYEALERGFPRTEGATSIDSTFSATRTGPDNNEWTIRQLSGPDWFDLANWKNPTITNEGRETQTEIYTGALNFKWTTPLRRFPTVVKFGGKMTHEERNTINETPWRSWSYVGPGGNVVTGYDANGVPIISPVGSWAGFRDPHVWDMGSSNIATLYDLRGNLRTDGLPRVDGRKVSDLFNSNPEQFVHTGTPANYLSAFVTGVRDIEQLVTASYSMADIRLTKKLQLRTGIRWERTESTALEFDPKTTSEMRAAGYPIGTDGRATTFPGINFQYFSNPRIKRTKEYDDFFPMAGLKYNLFTDLELQAGYNESISRPPPDSLTGTWTINDETQIITSPNPNLLPEYSKNFAARAAYYFNPAGQLSVSIAQNTIRNARITRLGSAEEFGINDSDYADYEFQAPFNVPTATRHRNLEVAYSQTLPFQSELLRGITVNASYSRSYASARRGNLTPHRFASSVGYRYRNFSSRIGVVWRDDTDLGNTAADIGRYRRHDTLVDLSAEYRVNRWLSIYAQGRNIFDIGQTLVDTPPGLEQGQSPIASQYQSYGALWNFGVKGSF